MSDLTNFLLARIAEDEDVAWRLQKPNAGDPWGWQAHPHPLTTCAHGQRVIHMTPPRLVAECEAKRAIVDYAFRVNLPSVDLVLAEMALPYADHPDYRDEWRP